MPGHYGKFGPLNYADKIKLDGRDPAKPKGFMSQEQIDNAEFESQMRQNEMEKMAEKLMSEDPKMVQKVQAELSRRFKLDPRRMNQSLSKVQTPQGRAALTMFGPQS